MKSLIETTDPNKRAIGIWLLFVAFSVFAMVVVGGATRLTESGLSMVNWNPVTGAIPPITQEEWMEEFNDYRTSPEYKIKNAGMSLEEFKGIFYWEWGHRLLGRLIGVFFLVPFLYFLWRKKVPEGLTPRLFGLFILGGLQGGLGWYMVKSGLVNEPNVSHFRLTAHLSLALIIFSALLWTALSLVRESYETVSDRFRKLTIFTLFILSLQIILGGFVAGLKAGYIMNTWPLMEGQFVPDVLFAMDPWWSNLVSNAVTLQFNHRMGAYLLFVLAGLIWYMARSESRAVQSAANMLFAVIILQIIIGVIMLLMHIPVSWGTFHQGGGVVVIGALLNLIHKTRGQG
ncbi:heme A synthase [Kordiimonas sediminis]|uniref:Heme A synthase n=1 Tax=Kordiimonas sediminis TaxID=1735581 RepID=A0A919AX83_9PROT|nr:COX15/CtaA family protein [Kordiimonas sediminis]GHF27793.1 heme A synthase [Kordiimonas sediminis]